MEALLIYLLKSAGLLSIFYLAYIILLKKETSFQINRRFLLGGILASAVLPAVYFTRKVIVEANNFSFNEIPLSTNVSSENLAPTFGIWEILGMTYLIITSFLLIRIIFQLYNIYRLIQQNKPYKGESFQFIETGATVSPFSFFKFIVYNPAAHSQKDLRMILQHEKIHAAQSHSLDILIANLTTALLWFNPLSWFYKKSVEENLEYIADRETVAISGAKKSYQQALVKVSIANLQPALTNHFYQSFIKKRILMLNKKSSKNTSLWKISLVFPLILIFMLTFNVKTEAQNKSDYSVSSVEFYDSSDELSAVVTKLSQQESLERLTKIFKKFDVALEFSEIEYSNELLTSIKVSFLNKKTNETGVFSTSDTDGIDSFGIFTNKKETGFRKVNALMGKGAISYNGSLLDELGETPLYIIDGKKYTSKELNDKYLDITENGMSISPPGEAKAKFGNAAQHGAIIAESAKIIDDLQEELKRIDKENRGIKKDYLQVEKNNKPSLLSINNKPENKKKSKSKKPGQVLKDNKEIPGNPLYVLNGEITKKEIIDLIDKSKIKSINVLKEESAISLYGEDAKDGAVIITTKVQNKEKGLGSHSIGTQNFKRKTDYQIMTSNSYSFSDAEDINAFQKYEEKSGSQKATGFEVKSNVYINGQIQPSPLVIIDGKKETAKFMKEELQPEDIEKINVIKGDAALEKYGEEAIDGVIEISTKKDKE